MPRIKARSLGDKFRRAGITFSKNPGEFNVDDKTFAILKAEPQLVVEVLPAPEPAKKTEPDTGTGQAKPDPAAEGDTAKKAEEKKKK